jgi:hypothetical protein
VGGQPDYHILYEAYWDNWIGTLDHLALCDKAGKMLFETCFWSSERWSGDRKGFDQDCGDHRMKVSATSCRFR